MGASARPRLTVHKKLEATYFGTGPHGSGWVEQMGQDAEHI